MAQSGSFSNITVSQRTDGSGFVDVYFTLSGPGAAYDLSLEVRFHSDSAYIPIPEEFLTGSYMGITPGSRSLVWDGLGSFPGTYSPDAKLKLIAVETEPCPETITDVDDNIYNTVQIGEQCWMKENLKTTKYRNGSSIEYPGSDNEAWSSNINGAYAWYDNDIAMKDAYGALYNWPATSNSKGLCPAGWHIPSSDEWIQLVDYLVDQGYPDQWDNPNGAGNALKSCRQVNSPLGGDCNTTEHPRWNAHSTHHGFDVFGFSALPGGNRSFGPYESIGEGGYWWSSTEYYDLGIGFYLYFSYGSTEMHSDNYQEVGFSVRCIRSGPMVDLPTVITNPVTNITATTATSGGNIAGDGGAEITARGVVWSTSVSPSLESNDGFTTDGEGTGEFSSEITGLIAQTTYYVRAYGTNSAGTGYGNQVQFTSGEFICETSVLYDIDGNTYNTVQIGDQCWMKENLKTTMYRNGESIVYPGSDNTAWQNNTIGAYAWHGNDMSWKDNYGALYNGYAVTNVNELCPAGWRAPSDQELTQLTDFINDINVGNILKSCRQINSPLGGDCNTSIHPRWEAHATHYGTDALGFSFLPAGSRGANGSYNNFGTYGYLWSSTEVSTTLAWYRDLGNMKSTVYRNNINKANGHSVRCVKNDANFTGGPTSGLAPLNVNFNDLSTNNPSSWLWDFGDGNSSSAQNPSHTYYTPGTYSVTLTTSSGGVSNTKTRTDYISVLPYIEIHEAWFPFDGNFFDYSGNNYHGVNMGTTWTTDRFGIPGKALSFNGSNSGVMLNSGYPPVFSGSLTFSCWMYFNDDSRGILFGSYNTAYNVNFEKHTDYRLRIYWNNGERDLYTPPGVVSAHSWYFVTFIRDVITDSFHIYLNGQLIETFPDVGSNIAPAGPFFIGRDSRTGPTVVFGKMDDIRIYGSALSDTEVLALYNEISTLPYLSTTPATVITEISAISGGQVIHAGGSPVTDRGVVWSTQANPTTASNLGITADGFGLGEFTSNLTGLDPATTYYLRAYASNATGTAYGIQLNFTTGSFVIDNDGNVYNTVQIGNQCWMKENLKTTQYQNGTPIEYPGSSNTAWEYNTTGAYAWYNNDSTYKDIYGALYNGYAVCNANSLCPAGWHIPTDDECKILEGTADSDYVVGDTIWNSHGLRGFDVGKNLKSTTGWYGGVGTDLYGFSALPTGRRYTTGTYDGLGGSGGWWSSSLYSFGLMTRYLTTQDGSYRLWDSYTIGRPVRCLKD